MNESHKIKGYNGIFATRFRELLLERKFTQKYVAEKTHSKGQTISQYVNGEVLPNAEKLYEIAKCFNVSADYLLGLADSPNPNINIREISKITGLTEESIRILQHNTKNFCEFAQNPLPQEALKYILEKYPDCNYPKFHIINLLLADRPINLNYAPILDALGNILAFKRQPMDNEDFYGLFKKLSLPWETIINEEYNPSDDYDINEVPHYCLGHNEILDILLLKLQGTINRYKDENDKRNNL